MPERALQLPVVIAMVVAASLAACEESSSNEPTSVEGPRARELVRGGATLLDVRTTVEFDLRHVEGAVNIPVGVLSQRMGEVPQGQPVVVYCQSGVRSGRAAELLTQAGYTVYDLGSIDDWPAD